MRGSVTCAAIVNPRIATVVTTDCMPYRSHHDAPVLRSVLDPLLLYQADEASGIDLARALRKMRPELDLYLLSDRNVEAIAGDPEADFIRRILYAVEEPLELHLRSMPSAPSKPSTPCPLPAASRCSSPNGSGTWENSTESTSSWPRAAPRPAVSTAFLSRLAISRRRRNMPRGHLVPTTCFSSPTPPRPTLVQAVMKQGDIAIVDRNCNKLHHYGMVLAGGQPLYLEAFPLTAYSMHGAVPFVSHQEGHAGSERADGRLDQLRMLGLTCRLSAKARWRS